jgi:hypothetical protein
MVILKNITFTKTEPRLTSNGFCTLYFSRPGTFQYFINSLPSKEFSFVLFGLTAFTNFDRTAQIIGS